MMGHFEGFLGGTRDSQQRTAAAPIATELENNSLPLPSPSCASAGLGRKLKGVKFMVLAGAMTGNHYSGNPFSPIVFAAALQ
jgi:hypothetical protein